MTDFERFAIDLAREAGHQLAERFRRSDALRVTAKGVHDFVTEADHASEALIVGRIRERFPDHAILAEEGSGHATEHGHRWIVDPLDATTNFIHGVPHFAVSIALEDPDGLLAAAIYEPLRDEMFHAGRGDGARLNGRPIRCSRPESRATALLATGFPFRELERLGPYLESFSAFIRTAAGIRRAGSAVLDLAWTACGRYDGFWEVGLSPWDVAAGALLVQEAGGVVTDVAGGNGYLRGEIVAASPTVHPWMVEITRRTLYSGL